ncbi:MAG TPA: TIGR00269 family protein, partial [Terriglobales bacterium]|nr:TIGR00269 family protein [Terriglobales bacterium]
RLITVDLAEESLPVPTLARFAKRPACAACGLAKRYYFDLMAHDHGFSVVATGHNLDDEAARLLGNTLRWHTNYLAKQLPVLEPNHPRFARKVRPLFRITEYETAVYAFLRKIDYVVDECPNSVGATQLAYKDALNRLEAAMPGTKLSFVNEFLRSAQPIFSQADNSPPNSCGECGMPCFGEICSFCNLTATVRHRQARAEQRASERAAGAEDGMVPSDE